MTNNHDSPGSTPVTFCPNPADEVLTIILSHSENRELSLVNSNGQTLWQGNASGKETVIDVGSYPEGLYYLIIYREENNLSSEN